MLFVFFSSHIFHKLCFDLRLHNKFDESNQHTIYKIEKNVFEKFAHVNIIKHLTTITNSLIYFSDIEFPFLNT